MVVGFELKHRWEAMMEFQHSQWKTTYSAGKAQSTEARTQYLRELNTSSHCHSLLITRSSLLKWSLKQAASILMSMFMGTSAWTFFRYQIIQLLIELIDFFFFIFLVHMEWWTTLICCFQDKWSSAYDVRTILISIQSLLGGNPSEKKFRVVFKLHNLFEDVANFSSKIKFQSPTQVHLSTLKQLHCGATKKVFIHSL